MALNCLACQAMQRTNSDEDFTVSHDSKGLHSRKLCCIRTERSWSGNLVSPPYDQMTSNPQSSQSMQLVLPDNKKVKKSYRRLTNCASAVAALPCEGNPEPKLVRSVGMRRDWSFEDLRQRNENRQSGRLA